MPDYGILFYDRSDLYGKLIERVEYFYPMPPLGECNTNLTYADVEKSMQSSSIVIIGNQMPST